MRNIPMRLYVDESGNTGETLSKELQFNFEDQPYYVLAGILVEADKENALKDFIVDLKRRFKIQSDELKAKKLYETKPDFIAELVDYIHVNKIPFFIEIMDKKYYLDIQIVNYFLVPSVLLNPETISMRNFMASTIGYYLNHNIYESFTETCKTYTNESLESFHTKLIEHFNLVGDEGLIKLAMMTRDDYFEQKKLDPNKALKNFLPIPDKNHKDRFLHLLPNF